MPPYLAACTTYRDHAEYLREWVEFHRLVGVERFFLYDNGSTDDHLDVLAPYLRDGSAVVHHWPGDGQQKPSYDDCIRRHCEDAHWVAFIDIDEFLFSPTYESLPDVLRDYEEFPGVGVNSVWFGSSGHKTRPPGFVIESYLHRTGISEHIRSIVNPREVFRCFTPHSFEYREGFAVNENHEPITSEMFAFARPPSVERLRVNHYYFKSEEEFREKLATKRPDTGKPREQPGRHLTNPGREKDEAILPYVAALREAVKGSS